VTRRWIPQISVIEIVVIGEFFACPDVANGTNNNPAFDFVGFAIRVAGVIDERSDTVAVNHVFAIEKTEQVCSRRLIVNRIRSFVGKSRAGVFNNDFPFCNRNRCVYAIAVDAGPANDESHPFEIIIAVLTAKIAEHAERIQGGPLIAERKPSEGGLRTNR
jgi:hypothetical protein